jgi:transposase
LRYLSDLTDAEWALVEPAIPPAKRGGRPRDVKRPRGFEHHLLRALDGLPVVGLAEGSGAKEHGALLLHAVGLGRHTGAVFALIWPMTGSTAAHRFISRRMAAVTRHVWPVI